MHYKALLSRVHLIEMRCPILEQEPNSRELALLNGANYLVRPKFLVNGLSLIGLYGRFFPEGVPEYHGETFQNLEGIQDFV